MTTTEIQDKIQAVNARIARAEQVIIESNARQLVNKLDIAAADARLRMYRMAAKVGK